jgi:hypothetical protein
MASSGVIFHKNSQKKIIVNFAPSLKSSIGTLPGESIRDSSQVTRRIRNEYDVRVYSGFEKEAEL